MFVTIRKYHGCTDVAELNRVVKKSLIPELQKLKGFKSYMAVDCGNHSVMSVGVFETRQDAEHANTKAKHLVKEEMSKLLPNAPEVTMGEVLT